MRRVFIMDDAEQLLPPYLRFVRGVVDSNDLPLNVSREILQESRDVEAIRSGCTKRVLGLLEDLRRTSEGEVRDLLDRVRQGAEGGLRRGPCATATGSRSWCASPRRRTDSETQDVALTDYVGRMKEGQKAIYYVTAETFAAAANSPHLEIFRKKGIEVLLLSDRIDEWVVGGLTEFEGKPLHSVAKGALDLGELADETEKAQQEKEAGEFKPLIERIEQGARRSREGSARVVPADRVAGVPGGG